MNWYSRITSILLCSSAILWQCSCDEPTKTAPPANTETPVEKVTPVLQYSIVATHPHDAGAFTEGLLFHEGKLYESTGAPSHLPQTRSAIGISDLKTGKFEIKAEIDRNVYFGEGMLILNGKVYQLTYQNQVGFIYDLKTFKQTGQFTYMNKEGWGMTTEGKNLIMSDGTSNLTFLNPSDFSVVKTVEVTENGYAVDRINELEFVNGFIYANIWMTNRIVKIDPASGQVVAAMDLSRLFNMSAQHNININEMNGIAYNPENGHLYVTGKMWPEVYELSLPL